MRHSLIMFVVLIISSLLLTESFRLKIQTKFDVHVTKTDTYSVSFSDKMIFPNRRRIQSLALHDSTSSGCPLRKIGDFVNKYKGIIGFYAVMLAPVYGIGIPFLGSMTDFETLKNRVSKNEYIVAPDNSYTPLATINEESPVYEINVNQLKKEIEKVVMSQPRITFIAEDKKTNRIEYVQRTLWLRFPDVITWKIIPINGKESTFAVHSYSVYGAGDLGVNANRIKGWIEELNKDIQNKFGSQT